VTGPHCLEAPAEIECDVLIIGSGAGGAVVAEALTGAGLDVVMVEEGPYLDRDRVPDSTAGSLLQMWRCGGLTAGLGKPPVAYAEGRCVGGSTEINSAIMQRVPDDLLETWAADYEIADFGPRALEPYYDRVAAMVNASLTDGPLGEASNRLRQGGEALGWRTAPLERAQRHCVATNLCALGCPTGGKQSMTATAIPRALGRGLRLVAQCRVRRLVLGKGRVVAARAVARGHDGRAHRVTLRPRQVFLSGGAVQSPALLRRSGLTHKVGESLRLHPTIRVVARFDREIDAHDTRLPLYAITEFMPEARIGGSFFQLGFFGTALAEDWDTRSWLLADWRRCGLYYAMTRARGLGRVSAPPGLADPLVRYALAPEDWASLAMGLSRLGEAMFAAGATHVYPSIAGHPGWTEAGQCGEFLTGGLPRDRTNLMSIHLFSSCPPGERAERSATDSFGRVRGVENLILADASQIPEAPGVNPQLTVMAMALRNAEAFLGGSRRADARNAFQDGAGS
jgi:choline dehydrogenase-like flavoprotein